MNRFETAIQSTTTRKAGGLNFFPQNAGRKTLKRVSALIVANETGRLSTWFETTNPYGQYKEV